MILFCGIFNYYHSNIKKYFLRKEVELFQECHQEGQGFLEYALIISIVAVIVIVVLYFIGPAVGNMFSNVIPLI